MDGFINNSLKQLVTSKYRSWDELGRELGYTRGELVAKILKGKTKSPRFKTLAKLATALDISTLQLAELLELDK